MEEGEEEGATQPAGGGEPAGATTDDGRDHSDVPEPDPASLPQPVLILRSPDPAAAPDAYRPCVFYILGSAHVSRRSADDAAALVAAVVPDAVFLELCPERAALLAPAAARRQPPVPLLQALRDSPFTAIYAWALGRVGSHLEVPPGEEFRAAAAGAAAVGAAVVLGDRPLSVTVARVWAALGGWERVRLLAALLGGGLRMGLAGDALRAEVERMKESDALTEAIRECGKQFPSLLGPLLGERDAFMVAGLRALRARGARRVVAVVGAGHLAGMRARWAADVDVDALLEVPPPRAPLLTRRRAVAAAAAAALVAVVVLRLRRR